MLNKAAFYINRSYTHIAENELTNNQREGKLKKIDVS